MSHRPVPAHRLCQGEYASPPGRATNREASVSQEVPDAPRRAAAVSRKLCPVSNGQTSEIRFSVTTFPGFGFRQWAGRVKGRPARPAEGCCLTRSRRDGDQVGLIVAQKLIDAHLVHAGPHVIVAEEKMAVPGETAPVRSSLSLAAEPVGAACR